MKIRIALLIIATSVAGCASSNEHYHLTAISPAKCYYDSKQNRQRCSDSITAGGIVKSDPRAYRAEIKNNIFDDYHKKSSAYAYGYDARYESGYRSATRFDTNIYEKN